MKAIGRLTARQVDSVVLKPGLHSDGGNLYLRVGKDGNQSWAFVYRYGGRQREAGLGKAGGKGGVILGSARREAAKGRALLEQKPPVDPLTVWRAPPDTPVPTFAQAAKDYIALHGPGWRNVKHAQQWRNTLANYCKPLMKRPVDQIGTEDVLACLRPIWRRAPETASRLRGRIETILDFAKTDDEMRPNPARWKGHLANKLPNPKEIGKRVKRAGVVETVERGHFAALPYANIPAFVERLRAESGVAARGLEFLLLTAARTGEALGAKWAEIDLCARTWTIPPARLKTGKKTRKPYCRSPLR